MLEIAEIGSRVLQNKKSYMFGGQSLNLGQPSYIARAISLFTYTLVLQFDFSFVKIYDMDAYADYNSLSRFRRERLLHKTLFIYFLLSFLLFEPIKDCNLLIVITEALIIAALYFLRTFDYGGVTTLLYLQFSFIWMIYQECKVLEFCISVALLCILYAIFEYYFLLIVWKMGVSFLYRQAFGNVLSTWFVPFNLMWLALGYYSNNSGSKEDVVLGASMIWTSYCYVTKLWTNFSVFFNALLILVWMYLKSKRFSRIATYMEPLWQI